MKILFASIVLLVWAWMYNSYFGHNWLPQSDAEVICDGITVIGILLLLFNAEDLL